MFFARKATETEKLLIKEWLTTENLPTTDIFNENIVFLLGELDDELVACGGLELYDDVAIMRGLYVKPSFRKGNLGETIARGLINLADKRSVKYIYTLIDDDNMAYFLAKMRYVPCECTDLIKAVPNSNITQYKNKAKAWCLDIDLFFKNSCCSKH